MTITYYLCLFRSLQKSVRDIDDAQVRERDDRLTLAKKASEWMRTETAMRKWGTS